MAAPQLAITVPLLLLGHDHDAGAHAAHELGSFDLSLAIAFVVGAIRPALAGGPAPPWAARAGRQKAQLSGPSRARHPARRRRSCRYAMTPLRRTARRASSAAMWPRCP